MPEVKERRFFDLLIDVYVPGRWYFKTPTHADGQPLEDPWVFSDGVLIPDPGPLRVPLSRPGKPLDFTSAGVGLTPVLNARTAGVFRALAPNDVQLFPVQVEGQNEPYFLLVVTRTVRCVDEVASEEVQFWRPEDGQPEKVGEYRDIGGLRIEKGKVADERVFRLWGWRPALIVDGELKAALEQAGIVGGQFVEV
ncbi:imm11 family protein [Corallococcus sp. 4LFB]|uniref:imm11 family protein n=1 Tax=Corallococcus sp. 4LFB TaxID=3383249 RepID=UPI003976961E